MNHLLTILSPYQKKIEAEIEKFITHDLPTNELSKVIAYALKSEAKRLRPAIVLMVAEAINPQKEVTSAALACEFFHTASLIADDLPCMDNALERRGHLTTHQLFGQAPALLASYALISCGYEAIYRNAKGDSNAAPLLEALRSSAKNTGQEGATYGQYLDLFCTEVNERVLQEVMEKKTGALFELSFVLGWLFAGGAIQRLPLVERLGLRFGMSFQLVDDLLDFEEDRLADRKINFALFHGYQKCQQAIFEQMKKCEQELEELGLRSPALLALLRFIEHRAQTPAPAFC